MAKQPPSPIFTLRGHQGTVTSLSFFTDSNFGLLSSSDCGEFFLWNLKTFRSENKWIGHNSKQILWVDTFDDKFLSQGRDGNTTIWKREDNKWDAYCTWKHDSIGFCQSSFLNTGSLKLLASPTNQLSTVQVIDIETMQVIMSTSKLNPSDSKYGMCMCCKLCQIPGSRKIMLICGFENGAIILYDVESQCLVSEIVIHKEPVTCLDFYSEHLCKGLSGSTDKDIVLWTLLENKLEERKRVEITNPGVTSIAVRSDSKIVCTGGVDRRIRIFSWKNMRTLAVLEHHTDTVQCVAFSKQGNDYKDFVLAAGSKDKKISIWSLYN